MKIERFNESNKIETPSIVGEYLVMRFLGKRKVTVDHCVEIFEPQLGFKKLFSQIVFKDEVGLEDFKNLNTLFDHLIENKYTKPEWIKINAWTAKKIYVNIIINYDDPVDRINDEANVFITAKKYNL